LEKKSDDQAFIHEIERAFLEYNNDKFSSRVVKNENLRNFCPTPSPLNHGKNLVFIEFANSFWIPFFDKE